MRNKLHIYNRSLRSLWPDKFHDNIKSQFYIKPKAQGLEFTIRHYAGKVDYCGATFLEKNKNFLPTEIIHLLRESSHNIIRWALSYNSKSIATLYIILHFVWIIFWIMIKSPLVIWWNYKLTRIQRLIFCLLWNLGTCSNVPWPKQVTYFMQLLEVHQEDLWIDLQSVHQCSQSVQWILKTWPR